jgi:TRAP-type C4-dicarboxylate transport system permease small subunit
MKVLRLLNRGLVRVETVLLVVFLGVTVVLAFAQVVMRNVFGTGLLWGDPLVRHLVLWTAFMGAAIATSEDRHISIDAINKFLPIRARHFVKVITSLFAAVTCYFLASAAWVFIQDERAAGGELVLSIPSWIGLSILPVGYVLLMIHFFLNSAEHTGSLLTKTAATET